MEGSRPATVEDLPRIAELAELARDELVPMKGGALWSAREAVAEPFEDAYGALIDRDDALVVVGTVDETVIGFGVVTLERLRTGETLGVISDLFVEPGAREVGVGEAMADDLVAFCDDARLHRHRRACAARATGRRRTSSRGPGSRRGRS